MKSALANFQHLPLKDAARQLLAQLGYKSDKFLVGASSKPQSDIARENSHLFLRDRRKQPLFIVYLNFGPLVARDYLELTTSKFVEDSNPCLSSVSASKDFDFHLN